LPFSSCRKDFPLEKSSTIHKKGNAPEELFARVAFLKKGLKMKVMYYNKFHNENNLFYSQYGALDLENATTAKAKRLENDVFIIIPFKKESLINNKVLIAFYDKNNFPQYFIYTKPVSNAIISPSEPYFLEKLNKIFQIAYNSNFTNNEINIAARGYGDSYDGWDWWFFDWEGKGADDDGGWDWNGDEWELDEVVVVGDDNYGDYDVTDVWDDWDDWDDDYYDYDDWEDWEDEDYNGYGNNSTDSDDTEATPCEKIQQRLNDSLFSAKMQYLKSKLNLSHETGYSQDTTGAFTALPVGSNNSLILPSSYSNIYGYMHTHQNEYEATNSAGDDIVYKPIKMFSPMDVIKFLKIAASASQDTIRNVEDVYAVMVSSSASYTLAYTGSPADLPNNNEIVALESNRRNLNREYRKLMVPSLHPETTFLEFMRSKMGIEGVSLYKVKNDGTVHHIKPITYAVNNMIYQTQEEECE